MSDKQGKLLELFALNVNRVLADRQMSRAGLAKNLGITRQSLHSSLAGKPTLEKVEEIAKALKVPPFYLLMPPAERARWDSLEKAGRGQSLLDIDPTSTDQLMELLVENLKEQKKKR